MKLDSLRQSRSILVVAIFLFVAALIPGRARAQTEQREDEIVANLAGGRVIVHVTRDAIVFAAIDQPIEANSVPPRVVELDSTHIGVLLGASEWQLPADPRPVRLDRNLQHIAAPDPRYRAAGEAEGDLEAIGVVFLEKLRTLVSQLHHKIDLRADEAILQIVVIGYAPNVYGPEVWVIEYRVTQEQIATRGEYWQTRPSRPRFTQLYPPEKKDPRKIVESRYPANSKEPTLQFFIEANEPSIERLRSAETRFRKVFETIDKGQAQKAVTVDAADLLRAEIPLIAPNAKFILGKMEEQGGFTWLVPPDEPVERAKEPEDKDRPPEAPSLRKRPNVNPN
jgi:hypothetical protein